MTRLNDEIVSNAGSEAKCHFLWDEAVTGFGVKITPAQSRIFVFQYRLKQMSPVTRRYTIGRYGDVSTAQARAFAVKLRRKLAAGVDPRTITTPWARKIPQSMEVKHRGGLKSKEEAILKAGAAIFFEKGYGASIDLISGLAGVSRQTIYNHFGSKTNLVRRVVQCAAEDLVAPLMSLNSHRPVEQVLLDFARDNYSIAMGPKGLGLSHLATSASTQNPNVGRDVYRYSTSKVLRTLEDYLLLKHREGLVHVDDLELASEQFIAIVLGLNRSSRMHGPLPTIKERDPYLRAAVDAFLRAYAPQTSQDRISKPRLSAPAI
jgi:AcrR family transcriptional regulator